LLLGVTMIPAGSLVAAQAVAAPVGNGFTVNAADLSFILKQIKIAERHSRTLSPAHPCDTLVGDAPNQIPDALTTYGLRTVDGSCNNLVKPDPDPTAFFHNRETFGAADQPFPRLTKPDFRAAEPITAALPVGPPGPTSYAQKTAGNVVIDSQPRVISNLIVDQTSTNPAAVEAAIHPVRTQGNDGVFPCTTDPDPTAVPDPIAGAPAGCTPSHQTLFIPNVTTDVGLSPPYNSMFTFFGQFFDHGVDQTVKSGGTVFVPLKADDPLRTLGPDGIAGTNCGTSTAKHCDEVPDSQAFMVLTRAQNQPGTDGILGTNDDIQDANNTDSPWVDQSQTYTSHASHQVFLREYAADAVNGPPHATGQLLGGLAANETYAGSPDGRDGIGTWAAVKRQASRLLGIHLVDRDVTNVPLLATDPYGEFLPGAHGFPQLVTASGKVEGDPTANGGLGVNVPSDTLHFDTPFLADIAHNADPSPQDADNNPATPPVAPTPDTDNTPSADFAAQPAGTYDDEMLDAHFACGDGRCNENIALSSIHQIFHSEHDRLVGDITSTLTANPDLDAAYRDVHPGTTVDSTFTFGERLFQAARFVTEMEYQHLVFEEFARKVQPAVRPFHVYTPDVNPAIEAEFAHAVYRFGHSMLDDLVARENENPTTGVKTDNSLPLLKAFLNPPEFFNNGSGGFYTPKEAAGALIMGSSDQVGNELDEFVTETLRNNLLGLPLDLPTINMTRARSEGIPRLNDVRRQIFNETNDGQLTPYSDWSDFGQHLKHPESLINFVAAYGKHPSIVSATTVAAKRLAARAIVDPSPGDLTASPPVDPDVQPADAGDFMFGTGTWANVNGKSVTGLEDVDLWVGGLAEVTNLFGGLLGTTFNYVFQSQLEKLQEGDRFYYLARTPGMNLRTQLEGNSFAELIERNTENTHTLKADAFATADCKFEIGHLTSPAPAGSAIIGVGSVGDDLTSECNENKLLLRRTDGTYQYRARNTVDTPGINGQSVYNGTVGEDRIAGGNDNDTLWGNDGRDWLEGQAGDDVVLGGAGDDIETDLGGFDVLKGGPGNDAIDTGPDDDISMGGDGQDFMNGGKNDNEAFAGPGNDFLIAGDGADAVQGDSGDDWIQGGAGQDLLMGDHGAPFFDDPGQTKPGNDIFVGQVGENDYDAEGGDDLMAQNAAVDRNAGAAGWDWAFHQYDTVGADDDMAINNNLLGLPLPVVVNRDRWQETEADSGSKFNDVIRGDDDVPADAAGAGFTGCDALDATGLARIPGLAAIVPAGTRTAASVAANSATGFCPLTGPVWGEGNILIGGLGNDAIEGRGGDDVIDGDRSLSARIAVLDASGVESGSTDLMEHAALAGTFGPGTAGMTLQQAVFAGLVNPGKLEMRRQIDTPTALQAAGDIDTAVFSGPRANYTVTPPAATATDAFYTVTDNVGLDGTDTLRNIERLRFTDQTVALGIPAAPVIGTASAGNANATVNWTSLAAIPPITSFTITVRTGETVTQTITGVAATATSRVVTGLTNGTPYTFTVKAVNAAGTSPESARSNVVTPNGPLAAPTNVVAARAAASGAVALTWTPPPGSITSYTVQVRVLGITVRTIDLIAGTATGTTVTGLTGGLNYTFAVRGVNAAGPGAFGVSNAVTAFTVPNAPPGTPAVAQGAIGGDLTATVTWNAPLLTGGTPLTGFVVTTLRMSSAAANATVVSSVDTSVALAPRTFTLTSTAPAGTAYRFEVKAVNLVGSSAASTRSAAVVPR